MLERGGNNRKRGPVALAELVGKALDPVTARRGFARAELISGWAEIVGTRYADCSRPEKIIWPRGAANDGERGILVVRIDGPRALLFQHEADQVVERVNAFVGQGAIGRIKIVQGTVESRKEPQSSVPESLAPQDETNLTTTLAEIENDNLRSALDRLGRAIFGSRDKKS